MAIPVNIHESTSQSTAPASSVADQASHRLLEALASLNQVGAAINRREAGDRASVTATLRLIVQSAVQLLPGASATIYSYSITPPLRPAGREAKMATDALHAAAQAPGETGHKWLSQSEAAEAVLALGAQAIDRQRRLLSTQHADWKPAWGEAACFPLLAANRPLGFLAIFLPDKRHFSQLELLLLDNFVNQAAMAIDQAHQLALVQRDLARTEDELLRLRRADLLISSRLRLEETLEAILQMALEMTGARYGIFRLVDRSGRKLITRAIAGDDLGRPAVEALPINTTSIMGWVAKHRRPLCIADLRANPWSRIYYPLDHDLEMRSELTVPLIGASGRLEGVLNLESPAIGAFTDRDSHLLQALATQAVIAIQEVRLLDALQEIAERLLTQPPQTVLERLTELACELLNAVASTIWVLEEDQLTLQAAWSGAPDARQAGQRSRAGHHQRGERLPLRGSLAGQAISERRPVTAGDVRCDPRFGRQELAADRGWVGALVAPLLVGDRGEPVGAFSVYSGGPDARRFAESEWDKKVLICLAHHAALAVHEAARQDALRAAQEQRAVAETFAAVGDIAANLLHRVNNKVGAIPVRVEGIRDKCQPALQVEPYLAANLAEIERSASEALEVMRESLFHLRPIQIAPVDVARCVAEAIAGAELPPGVRVQVEGLNDLPPVLAGSRGLTLVFVNLLENAATALEGEGSVAIRGAVHKGWMEIVVSDNGPGIPPALHERIFEFNFSGRQAHAGKLGFGLWWTKTLMARFGGSLSVASDGQHGAAFTLRLPLEAIMTGRSSA